jgi:hypothetical protein
MKSSWFQKKGYVFTRSHRWLSYLLPCIPFQAAILRNGHSVSDDLYRLFVNTTCTAFR